MSPAQTPIGVQISRRGGRTLSLSREKDDMNAYASSPHTIEHSPVPPNKQSLVTAVTRQPIYDHQQRLYAYDLMNPNATLTTGAKVEPSQLTAALICSTFLEGSLDQIAGPNPVILCLSRGLLIMDYALVLPADRVILEVATSPLPDTALVESTRVLAEQGYSLTLTTQRDMAALHPLIEAAHLIKINLRQWSRAELRNHVEQCQRYNAKLLADHVDTPADVSYCTELGFDYVQGTVFGPVETLEWYRSPTYRSSWRRLMTHLINPVSTMDLIETIFRSDLSLTYKLLRLVHTGLGNTAQPINSIRQALEAIDIRALMIWVSFVLLSNFDDMPHEMATTAAVRAHMCEFLAQVEGLATVEASFFTGLLSGLESLLDRPMAEILDALPLHQDIRKSLLGHRGELNRLLKAVLAYEQGRWDDIQALSIDSSTITDSYLQAIGQIESYKDVK